MGETFMVKASLHGAYGRDRRKPAASMMVAVWARPGHGLGRNSACYGHLLYLLACFIKHTLIYSAFQTGAAEVLRMLVVHDAPQ